MTAKKKRKYVCLCKTSVSFNEIILEKEIVCRSLNVASSKRYIVATSNTFKLMGRKKVNNNNSIPNEHFRFLCFLALDFYCLGDTTWPIIFRFKSFCD